MNTGKRRRGNKLEEEKENKIINMSVSTYT